MKLAYYLPITWESYIKLPLTVRHSMFSELAEIRKAMAGKGGGFGDQSRESRKSGLE